MSDQAPVRDLPLSMVTLIFGVLSVPLAVLRHLVSLAVVLAALALAFQWWGRRKAKVNAYTPASIKRSHQGGKAAMIGGALAVVMWVLWRTNVLLH
ncbi:MAG: hypothetical protein MUE88_09725 [Flavobacteriales bacterium]|jgi:hypothetical protein|nr:hypothetical protein [Flavobacteriales bacterium]